jgi:hypothetical protein
MFPALPFPPLCHYCSFSLLIPSLFLSLYPCFPPSFLSYSCITSLTSCNSTLSTPLQGNKKRLQNEHYVRFQYKSTEAPSTQLCCLLNIRTTMFRPKRLTYCLVNHLLANVPSSSLGYLFMSPHTRQPAASQRLSQQTVVL